MEPQPTPSPAAAFRLLHKDKARQWFDWTATDTYIAAVNAAFGEYAARSHVTKENIEGAKGLITTLQSICIELKSNPIQTSDLKYDTKNA